MSESVNYLYVLAFDDPSSQADYPVDKVRYQPGIAFFMYGDEATGRFVGAWRRDLLRDIEVKGAVRCGRPANARMKGTA